MREREEAGRSSIASSSSSFVSLRVCSSFIIYLIQGPLALFSLSLCFCLFRFPPEVLFCFFCFFASLHFFVPFIRSTCSFSSAGGFIRILLRNIYSHR